jgi:hypothetical protein
MRMSHDQEIDVDIVEVDRLNKDRQEGHHLLVLILPAVVQLKVEGPGQSQIVSSQELAQIDKNMAHNFNHEVGTASDQVVRMVAQNCVNRPANDFNT